MIINKWKQVLANKGVTQAELAERVGVGKPFLSAVVNGTSVLQDDDFAKACDMLDVKPEAIYSAEILNAIYKVGVKKAEPEKVSIKLFGSDLEPFFKLKRMLNAQTNTEVVRYAIMYALKM